MATGGDHAETARPDDVRMVPPLWRLLAWTLAVGVLSFAVRALVQADSWSYAMAWPAVAPQLVALLTAPRRQWPTYLAAFAAVQIVPARIVAEVPPELGVLATTTTVVFAALMMHRDRDWVSGRIDSLRSWQRFLVFAALAPLLGSPIGVAGLVLHGQVETTASALMAAAMAWYFSELVGIVFLVPLMLRWEHYLRRPHTGREVLWFAAMTALNAGLCVAAVTESNFVLLFLSGLPAMLVLIRTGIAGAFAALIVGPAIVLGATFAGYGPFAASLQSPGQALLSAQVFVLGAFAMLMMVAAALEDRTRLAALDNASHKAYELVAELTGDVVILVDADGNVVRRASPGHEILGLPDGPVTKEAWLEQVHPDDRASRADFPDAGTPGPSEPFRIRKLDGEWGWYVVHSRRTSDGLTVAVLRDVTLEREVQESLTDMANTDPLTGLANRRGLAQRAAEVWSRARAEGEQVTALFIDLDHFKSFNDLYGHQAGDECLRRVADVLQNLADPSVCVSARYGGEEFAVVLAGCDMPREFADGLAAAIRALRIPHLGTDSGMVTISVGVATLRPWHTADSDAEAVVAELLDRADKALYVAKSRGRNGIAIYGDDAVLIGEQVHHAAEHPREAAGGRHDD